MSTANALQELIVERIRQRGPISFADYMRMALYEPDYGYYVTGTAKMGWEGDYYTSSDISKFFAHCLGRQLQRLWEQLGRPASFEVLEQGAGRGRLLQELQGWARTEAADFGQALHYEQEDIRYRQDALTKALDTTGFAPAVIFSNELVDAFPVHIVEVRGEKLYEVYIDEQEGQLYEVLDEPSSEQVASYLDSYHIPWSTFGDGWRAEINLDALRWMKQTTELLPEQRNKRGTHGFIITIDYGDKARELYTGNRRRGTLASYYQHRFTERPLLMPGKQDLTAHVNFTALIEEGRKQGLRLALFTTQREWLKAMGIYEELEHLRTTRFAALDTERATDRGQMALLQWSNLRQGVAALTEPTGMGNFRVLILKR